MLLHSCGGRLRVDPMQTPKIINGHIWRGVECMRCFEKLGLLPNIVDDEPRLKTTNLSDYALYKPRGGRSDA